ncbi:hypothetical protein COCSADRAFT_156323 [Bipolaris sorokiniana ND90Pr]|uniref:Uncharacterized protein n=1 Tax=Cochliobolus sativus (strain ND90Pr / ATCC 201652) TaxID=665912 RepID=M2RUF3_COCSN|nr:uncharacterized protein COCSADRAFT_156323 [Bipolaris sorokiniana ND90Pr]EMD70204.1 hypothetical protein COCSADRAFT_156323 [Bipolaris sorokiniana ND90Pr]
MPESATNLTSFAPEEYSDGWTYEQIAARYISLCAEYLAVHTLFDGVIAARPFERESTIHNLQNARLRLENERQHLHTQIRQLERANQTNRNTNRDLRQQYTEMQETLNIVLQAQFQGDQEAREQHAKIERLEEENKSLQWQIQMLVKARDEDVGSPTGLWNKGEELQSGVNEMGKTVENPDGWVDEVVAEQEKMTKAKISEEQSCWDDNEDDDYNDDHFDI